MTDTEITQSTEKEPPAPPKHPWAELRPDRFRLLRGAAAHRTRRRRAATALRRAGAAGTPHARAEPAADVRQHPGQARSRKYKVLEVWADHRSKELRFGPDSGLHLEPANRGLGRFLLAQGAAWAQKRWGHYLVEGGSLPGCDERRPALRRDHCLRTQGFDVDYPKDRAGKATYGAPRASSLRPDWNSEKVQVVELQDAAAMLEQADRNLQAQENQIRDLQERIARFRREDGALRFTIVCLIALALFEPAC